MMNILYVALGGALGSVLRYLISSFTQETMDHRFPYGVIAVNMIGSFLIGFAWGLLEHKDISFQFRAFLFIGLFGGFTTFSTFAFDGLYLLKEGHFKLFLLNFFISNFLGILLVYVGHLLGSKF
jgi:CrcB protein